MISCWNEHGGDNPKRLSPLGLAFIGDAVYEVMIRERILLRGNRPASVLHKETIPFVCAQGQSSAYDAIVQIATDEEIEILKRGRNCSSIHPPKSSSMIDYRRATALEALLGYLYLCGREKRIMEIIEVIYDTILQQDLADREETSP